MLEPLDSKMEPWSYGPGIPVAGEILEGTSCSHVNTQVQQAAIAPDAVTLTTAMSACGRGRHWRGALSILQEIRRGGRADAVSPDERKASFNFIALCL